MGLTVPDCLPGAPVRAGAALTRKDRSDVTSVRLSPHLCHICRLLRVTLDTWVSTLPRQEIDTAGETLMTRHWYPKRPGWSSGRV